MLRAIIFDFNGVILNDEPLHFRSMRDAVSALGIRITQEEYWSRYLPLDDEACLTAICADRGLAPDPQARRSVLEDKVRIYRELLHDRYPVFEGAAELIREASAGYPLALASGARREEIEATLDATGLKSCFRVLVGAEDFERGKPHPESYLLALERLNAALDGRAGIGPRECLVIEDSVGGVEGSRAAGMICLAVANTYPRESLRDAHRIVDSLVGLKLAELEALVQEAD